MKHTYPRIVMAVLVMAGFQLAACTDSKPRHVIHPAHVEAIEGSDLHRVTLTAKAMERLNVKTAPVLVAKGVSMENGHKANGKAVNGKGFLSKFTPELAILTQSRTETVSGLQSTKIVPYASLIYTVPGDVWVYINPEPKSFVRFPVVVNYIEGDQAILSEGPPVGTLVATEGVAEIYGTEFEVEHYK